MGAGRVIVPAVPEAAIRVRQSSPDSPFRGTVVNVVDEHGASKYSEEAAWVCWCPSLNTPAGKSKACIAPETAVSREKVPRICKTPALPRQYKKRCCPQAGA